MASCLYECLYEAELEKYYPCFVAVGLQTTEQLADITMKDYPKLGVHNMDDRKRLFQLIKIVQSVQDEDEEENDVTSPLYEPGCVYLQPQSARSGPCRQLKFDSFMTNGGLGDCGQTARRGHDTYANKRNAGLLEMAGYILPEDSKNGAKAQRENGASACPQKVVGSKETLADVTTHVGEHDAPIIQRVPHSSGYNYGVPHSCIRANNTENEGPWAGSDKIRVCVRKRPLGLREERRGEMNVVTVEDKETVLIHEKKEAVDLKQYILQHVFCFDEVFSEALSNHDVYMRTAYPLIQHLFNGGHASCFAYGQTGAGKTYTMIGTPQNPGLYALAAKDIFRQLESFQPKRHLLVWISFYEIYCGQLYDLLNGRKRLFAREDGNHVVQIVGLREIQVHTVDLLLEVILKGSRERSTGATGVNSDSSRSHAIIQIQVKDSACRMFGRMSFIDLAGSERAADARESNKQTKFEGAEINQSLLALKECIRALDQEHTHTPFRQSKLTQVLKDSFIGNSKTCMIANISPSHLATEHTLNTLRYADRVKELKKGIKCCTTVPSRGRTVGNSSPKRGQRPSSVHQGEKNSSKKVKLGLQNSPNPSSVPPKLRAYPSLFHPANVPLSSTPKPANKGNPLKGNPSQPWLHRTTPIKGFLKAGKLSKKRTEDLAWHSDKVKGIPVGVKAFEDKEHVQQDSVIQHDNSTRSQKVQAVRPVLKQIVPRNRLPFENTHNCLSDDSTSNNANRLIKNNSELETNGLQLQKERDQHLRFYHEKFQQPPILQQKLKYQPLEKFLATYRPEEIRIHHDSDPQKPRCVLSETGSQHDDLDDSDFSEDSFSYASSQHKKKKRGKIDRNHLSFFLHHLELQTATDQKFVDGEVLASQYKGPMQAQRQTDRWCFRREPPFLNIKDNINHDSTRNHCDNCAEEESLSFSQNNATAEKPYSYQKDSVCKWKNQKNIPTDYKYNINNTFQDQLNGNLSLEETHNSSISSVLDYRVTETKARTDGPHALVEETAEMQQSLTEGYRQKETESDEDSPRGMVNRSTGSISGLMDPLSVSLLESEQNTSWEDLTLNQKQETNILMDEDLGSYDPGNALGPELHPKRNKTLLSSDRMPEFIKQMLKFDKIAKLQADLENENEKMRQTLDNSKSVGSLEGSLSSSTQQGSFHDEYLEAPKSRSFLSCEDIDDGFLITNPESREYPNSRQYDADTEESILTRGSPVKLPIFDTNDKKTTKDTEEILSLIGSQDDRVHNSSALCSPLPSIPHVTGNLNCENRNNSTENVILKGELHSCEKELGNLEDTVKLSMLTEETGTLKNKIISAKFVRDNLVETEQDSGCLYNNINYSTMQLPEKILTSTSSQTSLSELSNRDDKPLGKAQQLVVQAHREQLEEMTTLSIKEECLLKQISELDFKEYAAKLDEILLLKSRCVQSMRAQLQLYMAYPDPSVVEERTPAS
ncbi:kinesin-like protein KIF24 [Ambystoma mexicanum]|uniref:kinesin-like protein KIF24 n=1 Tax=Ambystoma mexicanum TaxID=8296 RepID=UPI0037E905F1